MEAIVVVFFFIVQFIVFFGTGYYAWTWVNPDTFMSVLGFLILWTFLEYVAYYAVAMLFGLFVAMQADNRNNERL